MSKYYLLSGKNSKEVASAFIDSIIPDKDNIIEYLKVKPNLYLNFSLFKLSFTKNKMVKSSDLSTLKEVWLDYLPNGEAWPLFSEKLKVIIENNLTGYEGLSWINAIVSYKNLEEKTYYIPYFKNSLDVLDYTYSIYVEGTDSLIKPVFSSVKILNYNIITTPESYSIRGITSALYISEKLMKAIKKEKLSGIIFEEARIR